MTSEVFAFYGPTNRWIHDHSSALSKRGIITDYVQLERITRKKYDNRIADNLLQILQNWEVDPSTADIVYVNSFGLEEKFFKISENNMRSSDGAFNYSHLGFDNLESQSITGKFDGITKEALVVPHELAQIFSCIPFYGMFKNKSLLIHIDGAASISNASAWYFANGKLELLEFTSKFYHALMNFSYNDLSFKVLEVKKEHHLSMPGKLMGFSSFGTVNPQLLEWLRSNQFCYSFNKTPELEIIRKANNDLKYSINEITQQNQFSYDFAACVQHHFEKTLIAFIEKHQLSTNAENLYFSGGAALSIKLNTKLVESNKFKELFIPPPAGDSGLSLGALAYHNWTNGINTNQISVYLNNYGLSEWTFDPHFSIDEVCKLLSEGNILGISTGNGEIGPRALGHRSIITTPEKQMFRKVSVEIKRREWYRPLRRSSKRVV